MIDTLHQEEEEGTETAHQDEADLDPETTEEGIATEVADTTIETTSIEEAHQ